MTKNIKLFIYCSWKLLKSMQFLTQGRSGATRTLKKSRRWKKTRLKRNFRMCPYKTTTSPGKARGTRLILNELFAVISEIELCLKLSCFSTKISKKFWDNQFSHGDKFLLKRIKKSSLLQIQLSLPILLIELNISDLILKIIRKLKKFPKMVESSNKRS